jgi:GTP-binding protein
MRPLIAIIGRPNVGKSTLFNRLCRGRRAIVESLPGVTRDRNYADVNWDGMSITIVDTGGFEPVARDELIVQINEQVELAVEEADALILLADGREGLNPTDRDILDRLRKSGKPTFFVVNKIDDPKHEGRIQDFYSLGVDNIFPISAAHGHGVSSLMDEVVSVLPRVDEIAAEDFIKVAVVGRPNVGKSSLINSILGQRRLMVSEIPGTTRDAIDTVVERKQSRYLFVDTAGIRRKGRIALRLEKYCVIKALKSIDRSHIALVLLDATEGVTSQDRRIAEYALDRGRGIIVVMNKWDLVEGDTVVQRRIVERVKTDLKYMDFAPIIRISALRGKGVTGIFRYIDEVFYQYSQRIPTSQLNHVLKTLQERHKPPLVRGKRLKILYATQTSTKPPTVVAFVNYPDGIQPSYKSYIASGIRRMSGLNKTPIRVLFRKKV